MNINKHLIVLVSVAFFATGVVGAGTAGAAATAGNSSSAAGEPAGGVNFEPFAPEEPVMTVSQRNAVRTARNYLDLSAFSRQGLIEQLEYEDFSTDDATFAVDHITVDWNEQAAKSALNYLDLSGFSRGGLIDQLVYEGFTSAQAVYGVTAAGL